MKRNILILVLVLCVLIIFNAMQASACTCFAVGKDASVDGSTFITIQQDTRSYDPRLFFVPAKDWPEGAMRPCPDYPQYQRWFDEYGNPKNADEIYEAYDRHTPAEGPVEKFEIPQVRHTYAYFHGLFGVMNEHQVSFGMPTLSINDALWNDNGKLRMTQLTMIAAERARTAREAIKIMGELAEKYGFRGEYTPGKGLGVGDPNEVWILHMMCAGPFWTPESGEPGAIWVAQRVPDDEVSVFPNGLMIGEIDFDDHENFMYSSNVKKVAEEMGWWDPDSDKPFNFMEAYSQGQPFSWSTRFRKWRGYQLVKPSLKLPDPVEQLEIEGPNGGVYRYPFSVKPDKKVSVEDLFQWTRDRMEATKFDRTKGPLAGPFGDTHRTFGLGLTYNGEKIISPRAISADYTQYSEVCQMRSWLPDPIGGIIWWSPGEPAASFRVPFYAGITKVPESHATGNQYEMEWGKTAYWAVTFVNTFSPVMYKYIMEDVREVQHEIDSKGLAAIPGIDAAALKLYETDPDQARTFLTQWCNQFAEDATERYWDLCNYLIVKYHNLYINKPKVAQTPKIPDEEYWKKIALEYQKEVIGVEFK